MGAFSEAGTLIIQTILELYLLAVILRLLLQVARADFYNPLSQAIVKITDPALRPLRKVIPGVAGIDMASIVLALIIQIAAIYITCLINGVGFVNPLYALGWSALGIVSMVRNIYFFTLIISIIVSWIAPGNPHPIIMLVKQLVEPIMAPFRRLMPSMGGLDLSPIFVFILLQVIEIFIRSGAMAIHLPPNLVLGI